MIPFSQNLDASGTWGVYRANVAAGTEEVELQTALMAIASRVAESPVIYSVTWLPGHPAGDLILIVTYFQNRWGLTSAAISFEPNFTKSIQP